MNDFASVLSTALHEEAKEIAMSADLQQAERQLRQSIRSVDRRRRLWIAVAAAAAVLVVVAGAAIVVRLPRNQPTQPPVPPRPVRLSSPMSFPFLDPMLTVRLPTWVGSAAATSQFGHGQWYGGAQQRNRGIGLFSVTTMHQLGRTKASQPTYAELVTYWLAIRHGYGTVSVGPRTRVDGRPATTMTVTLTHGSPGFVYCEDPATPRTDPESCQAVNADRLLHVAIVDQGTKPPTLLWESETTTPPDSETPSATNEFNAWLATVHFG